jgi:hypothetical protein
MAAMIDCDTGLQLCLLATAVVDCRSVKHNWISHPNSPSLRETPSPPLPTLLGLSFEENLAVWLRGMCHARVELCLSRSQVNSSSSPTSSFSWMFLQHLEYSASQSPTQSRARFTRNERLCHEECQTPRLCAAARLSRLLRALGHGSYVRLHEVMLGEEPRSSRSQCLLVSCC